MKEERLFYCTESEILYTLSDLEEFRQISLADGDTYATDTLEHYINACKVENNGTLEEIRILYTIGNCIVWNIKTDL